MTQDKRRDALIKELDIRRGDAVAQADYCLAREKKMLEEIEKPLKETQELFAYVNAEREGHHLKRINAIEFALATINKYKGE